MESQNRSSMLLLCFTLPTGRGCSNLYTKRSWPMSLSKRGMKVTRQQAIPLVHESIRMNVGFRADLIVESKVVVEIKSTDSIAAVHKKQLLTYLRLTGKKLGLLINFNIDLIKNGITRIVNRLE